MKTSAAWPVDLALETAALGDATLGPLLTQGEEIGWYAGRAPQGAPYPYVTNDDASEDPFALFQGDAQYNTRTLSIWGKEGKDQVLAIYGHLYRILHQERIPVEGFGSLLCRLRLVTYVAEPDTGVHHAIAECEVWTKKTA